MTSRETIIGNIEGQANNPYEEETFKDIIAETCPQLESASTHNLGTRRVQDKRDTNKNDPIHILI